MVADLLMGRNLRITGFLDPDASLWGGDWHGIAVLGGDEKLADYPPAAHDLVNGIGSVGSAGLRRAIFERYRTAGYRFPGLVHATATVAVDVEQGEGSQIMAGAIIQTGCHIGLNAVINTGAILDHDCRIGDHVHIAPGATLSGGVRVGENTHIGTGATVIQGIRIGSDCLVAAGAVVVRDVPDGSTVAGVPAKEGLDRK